MKYPSRVTSLCGEGQVINDVASHTGQPIGPAVFTVINFKRQKKDDALYFRPFYTHSHGYKMRLGVWPNGFSRGKGTHLGVTFHMMRGVFDDLLKWPFRGEITYMLLDQEGDDHIVKVLNIDDGVPDECTKRVVGVEWNTMGWGCPTIITLSHLQPKYLKNDSITVRIITIELTH